MFRSIEENLEAAQRKLDSKSSASDFALVAIAQLLIELLPKSQSQKDGMQELERRLFAYWQGKQK